MKKGKDWKVEKINDAFVVRPPKKEAREKLNDNDLVSFLPMEDLNVMAKAIVATKEKKLKDVSGTYTYFAENDVLLAKITPCFENGKLGIARNLKNGIGFGSSEYIVFRSTGKVISEYLFYYLARDEFRREGEKAMTGAAGQKRIPPSFVESQEIAYPPIPEQQQIVTLLDETFAALTKVYANAQQNQENARNIFELVLNESFTNRRNWQERHFRDIVRSNVIGLIRNSREQGAEKKYKYVKMNNITWDNDFDFSNFTRIDAADYEVKKYSLENGDFLFNTRNSKELVGKTCIYRNHMADNREAILYNNNIMRVRFSEEIDSRFINYQFSTQKMREKLNLIKSGTTNVSAIYYKKLQFLPLHIPSLPQQLVIVNKLDSLAAETKQLEGLYQSKMNTVEELRKSILQKVFEGTLL